MRDLIIQEHKRLIDVMNKYWGWDKNREPREYPDFDAMTDYELMVAFEQVMIWAKISCGGSDHARRILDIAEK